MIDTDLYVSISRNGTIKTVLLPLDAPFNPKDYASFGTDEGWPLYYVNGRQWKVSWGPEESGVAVFTELMKWPEEEDTYITIYQWQLPMSVKTSGNAPFDITEYTPVGITDDGWNLYNVRGVTWKVWAMGGHVQYTEMEDSNKNTNMPIRWTNIIQNGTIWKVVLRDGSPFDPNNYQIVDVDADGWPIFLVDRIEWVVKVSYDDASALPFAKFERRIIERPVNVAVDTIYRNGVAVDVELGSDAPFIPSQQTVAGISHDGWPEYNIGGRLWKVSSDRGVAVFTEMTWPIEIVEAPSEKKEPEVTDQMIPGDREIVETPIKVIENVPDVEVPLSNGSTADSSADLKLEVEYVPFVVLVGLLGIFSIAAQRK